MDNFKELLVQMCEGNPGALSVLMKLVEAGNLGMVGIMKAYELNITGPDLWLLYKNENGCDINKTAQSLCSGSCVSQLKKNRDSKFYKGEKE